ncbi:hypothetical protein AN964_23095 [Heyndrickxia shackletonii]|uniref:DUF4179 domain-containing protein n=1 Tax=Heyndrickxia shackletonii TaxID=157838 RepID=A0A0Q3WRS3_9BACI|nr:DUF4179 domain-containing protein [Heyndrickxia shackletonii]KQL50547.1 hypothetical protein AN964_23095 [Heyndrickxia shackletonii]
MITAKIESNSITLIREKNVESAVDWFNQHKQSFYILGWCYFRNQHQIEELFYRSIIKVNEELPRFKNKTSYETWITSIFIQTSRELSDDRSLQVSEESELHKDLFKALNPLKQLEKEAVILTYILGISKQETAHLLKISVEELKDHLFSGIQSLKKGMGYESSFNGCKEYHKNYIDYLEKTLDRSKKIDLEKHIYHCQECQDDLSTFQDIMLTILNFTERMDYVPSGFMENVKDRLAEKEKHRQRKSKKRKKIGLVFASVFVLVMSIGFFTGSFTDLYYTWTIKDQQLRALLQHNLGEKLNLVAESNGVKIRITGAIADDVQTLVFYEIEDTADDNQYVIGYDDDGVVVENKSEIMNPETYPRYHPPDLKSDINNKEKNVYHGKMSLQPLTKDKGTIKLTITKLQKIVRDSSDRKRIIPYEDTGYETGEWNFDIPVTKSPSKEYALAGKTKVEGVPVRFEKLTIAPTATILQLDVNNGQPQKRIDFLNVDNLEVNNKKVKTDIYGSSFASNYMDWSTFQILFDPLFGEKPKEINVQFNSVHLTIQDEKTIKLDASKGYPQTFEYAGSTISIDKVEVGQPANVVISNREIKNRAYDSLQLEVVGNEENEINSREMNSEGVLIDKNGVEYDINDVSTVYEEIEQPRYLATVQNIMLESNNTGEKVIPKKLVIHGYNTTKYLDDVVKLSLKHN